MKKVPSSVSDPDSNLHHFAESGAKKFQSLMIHPKNPPRVVLLGFQDTLQLQKSFRIITANLDNPGIPVK